MKTGTVKWFNAEKDLALYQLKVKKMYLFIFLQFKVKDIKL